MPRKTAREINTNHNHSNSSIHFQHTTTSLQNKIPHPKYSTNIQTHDFKTTFTCLRSIAGVPSKPKKERKKENELN